MACNVFWKVEGLVSLAAGTFMRGTIIANNAAINLSTGDTLEGRALTTNGAVSVDGVLTYTPIGCGSPVLTGPKAPALGSLNVMEYSLPMGRLQIAVLPTLQAMLEQMLVQLQVMIRFWLQDHSSHS